MAYMDVIKMRTDRSALTLLFLMICVAVPGVSWGAAITITAGTEPRQTFKAFGYSIPVPDNSWIAGKVTAANREAFATQAFDDLHTKTIRWWFGPSPNVSQPGYDGVDDFKRSFVDTGITADARRHGVTYFQLAPWENSLVTNPQRYAEVLSDNILHLKNNFGVTIDATGIMNEPGAGGRQQIPKSDYLPLVKNIRAELNRRGLHSVALIGPEFASANSQAIEFANIIDADREAAAALQALASHSYNMAVTPELANLALKNGWDYWQTEAGGDAIGADASARLLNDINHAVTHWTFFIGPGAGCGEHTLLAPGCKSFTYYYLQQISNRIVPGTKIRYTKSSIDGTMTFTYGQKPHLNAAIGVRSDGKWVAAAVNMSRGGGWEHGWYYPSESHTVTIRISELSSHASVAFETCRTLHPTINQQCGETVQFQNGQATVTLRPKELITLVAQVATEPSTASGGASGSTGSSTGSPI